MGIRTTLYSEARETVAAFEQEGCLDFGSSESLDLDKAAPVIGYLIGQDHGRRGLCYAQSLEVGEAAIRGFRPEDVGMLLRRLSDGELVKQLELVDWNTEVAGKIYPFQQKDSLTAFKGYILEHGQELEDFLSRLVAQGRGMITVEA